MPKSFDEAPLRALEESYGLFGEHYADVVEGARALFEDKELALWIEEHDTELLPVINGHTAAINALNTKVDTGEKTVATYVADAIAAIPAATATTLGLVKASGEVTVAADGTLGIGQVSTDKLVQGNMTLILDGGDAEVPAN